MTPSLDIMTIYNTCQDLVQTIIACHTRALRFIFAMTGCVCAFHYQIYIKTCHCHLGCHIHITIQLSKLGLFADNISSYNISSLLISMSPRKCINTGDDNINHTGIGLHSQRLSPAWSSRCRVSLADHHI